jgi:hypothetical protein
MRSIYRITHLLLPPFNLLVVLVLVGITLGCNSSSNSKQSSLSPSSNEEGAPIGATGDIARQTLAVSQYKASVENFASIHAIQFRSSLDRLNALPPYDEMNEPNGMGPYNETLALTYYDFAHALFEASRITGNQGFIPKGDEAAIFFRDRYVMNPRRPQSEWGRIPGFWNFTDGLREHAVRTRDKKSREAVLLLSQRAAYADDGTPPTERLESPERSREVAYAINALLNAQELQGPPRPRLSQLISFAKGHVAQWNNRTPWIPISSRGRYIHPFMLALTARALIRVYKLNPDAEILQGLTSLCDTVWSNNWSESDKALFYSNRESDPGESIISEGMTAGPTPDLHLLIFPLFSWVASETGTSINEDRAAILFNTGVTKGYWNGAKQYNQSLVWSREGLSWLE